MSVTLEIRGPVVHVEAQPRATESVTHRTCDVCGRAELRSGVDVDWSDWELVGGVNNTEWIVCPKCRWHNGGC
jgi:hypothetical protein